MSAGTLTLANNSDVVTGLDTSFTTESAAGDFIVVTTGGVTYTLPVKSIESDTALTLSRKYNGPAVTDAAWTAMPRDTMNRISAQIAADTAYIIRQRVLEVDNWYQLLEVDGEVTIVMADGSTYTGPSWLRIINTAATKIDGAIPVEQGGTGATTAKDARTHLELDRISQLSAESRMASPDGIANLFIKNTDSTPNSWGVWSAAGSGAWVPLSLSAGGTGGTTKSQVAVNLGTLLNNNANVPQTATTMDDYAGTLASSGEMYSVAATNSHSIANWPYAAFSTTNKAYGWGALTSLRYSTGGNTVVQIYVADEAACNTYVRTRYGSAAFRGWAALLSDKNTTVDSSGFIKKASPIVKIWSDGEFEVNDESEGCVVTRLGVGEYLIDGCVGMNADASWGGIDGGFEIPLDRNKQPLIWLDYDVNADGSILIKTYHRTHPDAPEFARNLIGSKNDAGEFIESVKSGESVDIPADQFVSVRVEMPVSSVYNRSLLERTEVEALKAESADLKDGSST